MRREMNVNFGGYIKGLRVNKGYSLHSVSQITGTSASYLNRVERGIRKCVSLPIIESLARCYGRSPLELVEIALNDTYNSDKLPLFETILYNNRFVIDDREVSKEAKDAIFELVNEVMNLKWLESTKVQDALNVITIINKFKNCIS